MSHEYGGQDTGSDNSQGQGDAPYVPPRPVNEPQATIPLPHSEFSTDQTGQQHFSEQGPTETQNPSEQNPGAEYAAGASFAPVPSASAKSKRHLGLSTVVVATLIGGLIGGGVVAGVGALTNSSERSSSANTQVHNDPVMVKNPDTATNITAAAQKAGPSVVTISASGTDESGTGSGIILDKEGHILTNTHVVTLGGDVADAKIQVQLSNGKVYPATKVGIDPTNDVAVVKIDAPDLTPATLGNSNDLNVGEPAIAIGAPLGLSNTVTDGIISTLNRTISVQSSAVPDNSSSGDQSQQDPQGGGDGFNFAPPYGQNPGRTQKSAGVVYINVIQTDAAINPGNSGGALVNDKGEVIGVNVAIASAGQDSSGSSESGNIGVGFAIPINNAKRIADEIIKSGSAQHGFLGATISQAGSDGSNGASGFSTGAKVEQAQPDGPAGKAGLKTGDIITGVGDRPITGSDDLIATVREYSPGSKVDVHFTRDGKDNTAQVTLGAQQASQ